MKKITVQEIYNLAKEKLQIRTFQDQFFQKSEENWKPILPTQLVKLIRKAYSEDEQKFISSSAVKEVLERLLQDPYMQADFVDKKNENFIRLSNAVFNVKDGREERQKIGEFSYYLNFTYVPVEYRECPVFEGYLKSVFPEETEVKRRLLLQILGYCISDYTKAKAAFFLIGASNSGKSTMLELVKRILPEQSITYIPLYRLGNRFNLARLANAKLNICSEISEKSFDAVDILKMLTSNEFVTAEHKGGRPFEFRIRCKSLNAGNVLPELKTPEGINAIVNRMILLLFPVSVPKEQQDESLLDKLFEERSSIFSFALDELTALKKERFQFVEPKDSMKLKKQLLNQNDGAIDIFIQERCVLQKGEKTYMKNLYDAYREFCEDIFLECIYTKTKFSQFLAQKSSLTQKKMRINHGKSLSGVEGIRLKNDDDEKDFSETKVMEQRNNGTEKEDL